MENKEYKVIEPNTISLSHEGEFYPVEQGEVSLPGAVASALIDAGMIEDPNIRVDVRSEQVELYTVHPDGTVEDHTKGFRKVANEAAKIKNTLSAVPPEATGPDLNKIPPENAVPDANMINPATGKKYTKKELKALEEQHAGVTQATGFHGTQPDPSVNELEGAVAAGTDGVGGTSGNESEKAQG